MHDEYCPALLEHMSDVQEPTTERWPPSWCFHLSFPIRHNQLLVVTAAQGSPGNDGPSPLIGMKFLEAMGRLPTSPLPPLGIVWAQIGDNTWVKGGLFFHNALPLLQEEENPFRCQEQGLSLNSGPSLISHMEAWRNSFVTFMTYWEINSTPSPHPFSLKSAGRIVNNSECGWTCAGCFWQHVCSQQFEAWTESQKAGPIGR